MIMSTSSVERAMPKEHARLTVLLDAGKKKEFDQLCAELGTNASQVVRELIGHYLAGSPQQPALRPQETPADGGRRMDGSH
jgi:hypothetical protein